MDSTLTESAQHPTDGEALSAQAAVGDTQGITDLARPLESCAVQRSTSRIPKNAKTRWILAAVLSLAAMVRVVYYAQLVSSPAVDMHHWQNSDMNYYNQWARKITDGDWLGRTMRPPVHGWHILVADRYFELHPERRTEFALRGAQLDPPLPATAAVWLRWMGGEGRFYQEPAYPYAVAATYALFGPHPKWVFVWQMALGLLATWLTWRITLRHFGVPAAAVASLVAATCAPIVFHEGLLLRDSLVALMALVLVDRADRAFDSEGLCAWFVLGLVWGFALMVKAIFLPFGAGLLLLTTFLYRRNWKRIAFSLALMIAGAALMLAPLMVRNIAVGHPPMAFAGNGGFTFIVNNTVDFPPSASNFISVQYLAQILGETGGRMWPSIVETLKTHPSVLTWLNLVRFKWFAVWGWWERPDSANLHNFVGFTPALRFLPTYWVIAPWLAIGTLLVLRKWPQHATVLLMAGVALALLLMFNALSRWRLPLILLLAPFAGNAVILFFGWVKRHDFVKVAAVLTAVAGFMVWTAALPDGASTVLRVYEYWAVWKSKYVPAINEAIPTGDWDDVADLIDDFLRYEPDLSRWTDPSRSSARLSDANQVLQFFSAIHKGAADVNERAGRSATARNHRWLAAKLSSSAAWPPER